MSSSLANCYRFHSESKNKKTCFNFLRPSEMRHSYLRYPNLNRDTMPVCYCWSYSKWRTLYSRISYSEYPTLNSWVFYSECPTPYNRASYSEFPTPYKCLLIPLHRFSDEVSYGECMRDSGNPCMCSFGKSTYRVKTCCVSFSAKTVTGSWIIK